MSDNGIKKKKARINASTQLNVYDLADGSTEIVQRWFVTLGQLLNSVGAVIPIAIFLVLFGMVSIYLAVAENVGLWLIVISALPVLVGLPFLYISVAICVNRTHIHIDGSYITIHSAPPLFSPSSTLQHTHV